MPARAASTGPLNTIVRFLADLHRGAACHRVAYPPAVIRALRLYAFSQFSRDEIVRYGLFVPAIANAMPAADQQGTLARRAERHQPAAAPVADRGQGRVPPVLPPACVAGARMHRMDTFRRGTSTARGNRSTASGHGWDIWQPPSPRTSSSSTAPARTGRASARFAAKARPADGSTTGDQLDFAATHRRVFTQREPRLGLHRPGTAIRCARTRPAVRTQRPADHAHQHLARARRSRVDPVLHGSRCWSARRSPTTSRSDARATSSRMAIPATACCVAPSPCTRLRLGHDHRSPCIRTPAWRSMDSPIPAWRDAIELAAAAQRVIPQLPSLGWDMAHHGPRPGDHRGQCALGPAAVRTVPDVAGELAPGVRHRRCRVTGATAAQPSATPWAASATARSGSGWFQPAASRPWRSPATMRSSTTRRG